jgi:hypothetical protein
MIPHTLKLLSTALTRLPLRAVRTLPLNAQEPGFSTDPFVADG